MSLNSFRGGMGRLSMHPVAKTILFVIGAVLVFSLVYSGLGSNLGSHSVSSAQSGQDVVATVNGTPITRSDFQQDENNILQEQEQIGNPPPGPMEQYQLDSQTLDQLISSQEQIAQAKQMGITASSADIKAARQQEILQSQIRTKLGLPANATDSQIDTALANDNSPSLDQIFPSDSLREAIILNKLQAAFNKPVTMADALNYYKEYHTQHILISNQSISDVQAKLRAQQVLAKVLAPGASFAALAKQYSDDPGTKNKGGDDGWIGEDNSFNSYIPQFVQAVQALKAGQVTPAPVKTPQFGYFIIKLDATRENLPKDFKKNQAQYLTQIQQQQAQSAYSAFVTGLKDNPANKVVVKDAALRGDQDLAQAQQTSDLTQRAALFQAAVAAYNSALKTASAANAGSIEAALGQAYQALSMTPQAIGAYQAAVNDTHDQTVELALGQLYQQNHQNTQAIAQYEAASKLAWDDPQVHQQLASAFTMMGQPSLAAKEQTLYQQIQKRQKAAAAAAAPDGLPPGATPLTLGNGAPQTVTIPATASGAPAPPVHAPAQ